MHSSIVADDQLVEFFSAPEPRRSELALHINGSLKRLARLHCADLVRRGLGDDVVQEAWVYLLGRPPRDFDPARGPAGSYLKFAVLKGGASLRRRTEGMGFTLDLEEVDVADKTDVALHVAAQVDAESLFDVLTVEGHLVVVGALRAVYSSDLSFEEAAKVVGLSRFQLRRRIDAWLKTTRWAK